MKRLLSIAAIGVLAVTALVMVRCNSVTGGAPTDVALAAATDSTVKVTWTAPSEGTPDKYIVMFSETGTDAYEPFDTVITTEATHNPAGKTGTYKVVAKFGSTDYDGTPTPTTTPISSAVISVSELNAAGSSGYGWTRADGSATTYTMTQASNAASVDFYITDFATGYSGPDYSVASPDLGPSDPTGVVPSGSWRINGFTAGLSNENSALPMHSTSTYFNYQEISTQPFLTGCYTADGYYALVKVDSYNTGSGTAQVRSWFQKVKGLRLIEH